jgi:hypothetical protein
MKFRLRRDISWMTFGLGPCQWRIDVPVSWARAFPMLTTVGRESYGSFEEARRTLRHALLVMKRALALGVETIK